MRPVGPDDRQLLLGMHRGDEASARLVWRRHAPRLIVHAVAILRERGAAEDAVQAVMCRLLELPRARLAAVRDGAAFLSAAVRREALNQLRSRRREAARRTGVGGSGTAAERPRQGAFGELAGALAALPRHQREIVVLKHIGELTFDQIALALGANRNTVAARYRAALTALRSSMDPCGVGGGAHG